MQEMTVPIIYCNALMSMCCECVWERKRDNSMVNSASCWSTRFLKTFYNTNNSSVCIHTVFTLKLTSQAGMHEQKDRTDTLAIVGLLTLLYTSRLSYPSLTFLHSIPLLPSPMLSRCLSNTNHWLQTLPSSFFLVLFKCSV